MGQARLKKIKAVKALEELAKAGLPVPELTPAQKAAVEALAAIKQRSFSGRHQDLGKMINCKVCSRRHRESIHHEQVFAKRKGTEEQLIAGKTLETESLIEANQERLRVGAAHFKGKRRKPHLNKKANEFVQLVYDLLPDEYDHELLVMVRRRAKRILAKKYGRYGFLPSIWQNRKEKHVQ